MPISKYFSKYLVKEFIITTIPLVIFQLTVACPYIIFGLFIGYLNNSFDLSVFGFANTFFNFGCYPLIIALSEVAGAIISRYYGKRDYKNMMTFFIMTFIILAFLLLLYFLIIINSKSILLLLNSNELFCEKCSELIIAMFVPNVLVAINITIETYLISQNIYNYIMIQNIVMVFVVSFLSYYWIIQQNMSYWGSIPSKYVQELLLIMCNVFLLLKVADKKTTEWQIDRKGMRRRFWNFFKKYLYSLFGIYGEAFSFEVNSIFAMLLNSVDDLAVWVAFTNVSSLFFYMSMGISSTFRTNIGQLIGRNQIKDAKKTSISYYLQTFILSVFLSLMLYFMRDIWSQIFFKQKELVDKMLIGLNFLQFNMFSLMIFYSLFSVCRLLNEDKFFFRVMSIYYPIIIVIGCYLSTYVFKWGIIGIIGWFQSSIILTSIVFLKKIYFDLKWDKIQFLDRPSQNFDLEEKLQLN